MNWIVHSTRRPRNRSGVSASSAAVTSRSTAPPTVSPALSDAAKVQPSTRTRAQFPSLARTCTVAPGATLASVSPPGFSRTVLPPPPATVNSPAGSARERVEGAAVAVAAAVPGGTGGGVSSAVSTTSDGSQTQPLLRTRTQRSRSSTRSSRIPVRSRATIGPFGDVRRFSPAEAETIMSWPSSRSSRSDAAQTQPSSVASRQRSRRFPSGSSASDTTSASIGPEGAARKFSRATRTIPVWASRPPAARTSGRSSPQMRPDTRFERFST